MNLKKYLAHAGKWQFFPVLRIRGKPEVVLINGEPVKGTSGKFYLDYRQDGILVQRPYRSTPREVLEEWRRQQTLSQVVIRNQNR